MQTMTLGEVLEMLVALRDAAAAQDEEQGGDSSMTILNRLTMVALMRIPKE